MTQPTLYVGLDNGTSGAVAFLYPDGNAQAFPTVGMEWGPDNVIDDVVLRKRIREAQEQADGARLHVVFERSQKNPEWGAKTNFLQGDGGAVFRTMVRQNGWSGTAVNPKDWQGDIFRLTPPGGGTKDRSIRYVQKFFPAVNLVPPRCRKPHDGMADALCIASWGRLRGL